MDYFSSNVSRFIFKSFYLQFDKLELHVIDRENPEKLTVYPEEELLSINGEKISYEVTVSEEQLGKMSPNLAAIQQFKKKVMVNNQWSIVMSSYEQCRHYSLSSVN